MVFWITACLLPSLLISSLSFFLPMDNLRNYDLHYFAYYELRFLALSAAIFVGASSFIHGLVLALYENVRRKYFAGLAVGKQWLLSVWITICFYTFLSLLWLLAGYTVNTNFATIVLPVYFLSMIIGMKLWLSPRKMNSEIE